MGTLVVVLGFLSIWGSWALVGEGASASQEIVAPLSSDSDVVRVATEQELRDALVQTTGKAIVLTKSITLTSAPFLISRRVRIEGDVNACKDISCAINGGNVTRHFTVDGGRLSLRNLALRFGAAYTGGSLLLTSKSILNAYLVRWQGNKATGTLQGGGAVAIHGGSVANFQACVFTGNEAPFGGAMEASESSVVWLYSTLFEENKAGLSGGALSVIANGRVAGQDAEYVDNSAWYAGAINVDGAFYFSCLGSFGTNTATQGSGKWNNVVAVDGATVSICNTNSTTSAPIATPDNGGTVDSRCTYCVPTYGNGHHPPGVGMHGGKGHHPHPKGHHPPGVGMHKVFAKTP